jgi:hypothetical protein
MLRALAAGLLLVIVLPGITACGDDEKPPTADTGTESGGDGGKRLPLGSPCLEGGPADQCAEGLVCCNPNQLCGHIEWGVCMEVTGECC